MATRTGAQGKAKGTERRRRLPNPVTLAVGKNLKSHRLAAGKTQVELAYDAEVERSRISKLESGLINPSLLTLATLCYSLGITLPVLFGGVSATLPPLSEGGPRRRANQATLEKPGHKRTARG
jgi:transcriptional regulator with XRE-family HTH domain